MNAQLKLHPIPARIPILNLLVSPPSLNLEKERSVLVRIKKNNKKLVRAFFYPKEHQEGKDKPANHPKEEVLEGSDDRKSLQILNVLSPLQHFHRLPVVGVNVRDPLFLGPAQLLLA